MFCSNLVPKCKIRFPSKNSCIFLFWYFILNRCKKFCITIIFVIVYSAIKLMFVVIKVIYSNFRKIPFLCEWTTAGIIPLSKKIPYHVIEKVYLEILLNKYKLLVDLTHN